MNTDNTSPLAAIYNKREYDAHVAALYQEVLTQKESLNVVREKMHSVDFEQIQADTKQIREILASFAIIAKIAKWCAGLAAAVAAVATAVVAVKVGVQSILLR